MNHNNFCPQGGGRSIIMTNGLNDFPCICDLLQRAHETWLDEAADRVIKLCAHTKFIGCIKCEHDKAIDAIYGENS